MNLVWLIVSIVIAYVYLSYYYRYPKHVSILQTSLSRFDLNLLQEKQPIVLEDAIKDVHPVIKAWFPWNPSRTWQSIVPETWSKNKYKYLVIHPHVDTELFLYPPNLPWHNEQPDPEYTVLILQLKAHQMIIVPFHWKWMLEKESPCQFTGLHDGLTWILP